MIHKILNISLIVSSLTVAGFGASYAAGSAMDVSLQKDSAILINTGIKLPVSTASPSFTIDDMTIGRTFPISKSGIIKSEKPVVYEYSPITLDDSAVLDVKLYLQWSKKEVVLRKWAEYRLTGSSNSHVVREIILDDIDTAASGLTLHPKQTAFLGPHSYPIFFMGFFAGIEFPIASTRIIDGHVITAHKPGVRMKSGVWYQSRKAVYGITPIGGEWQRFRQYIESHRPEPRGIFVIYDNWLTTANSYTEKEMLDLMHLLDQKLYRQNGVSLDAFRLVCTWSDPKSIWEIDRKRLPDGLTNFQKAVEAMGCKMGLWISPASCYPFAQDPEWAAKNGYETFTTKSGDISVTNTCMAGIKYRTRFRDNLLDIVKTYDMHHIQFDGYRFECTASDHGHEPGELSAEAVAQGMIDVFKDLRAAAPKIYLHGAYGGNPSPWWLNYINAFLVYYGDDAPFGRIAAPSYRDSCITGRDQANLQSSYGSPAPITAHDVYGLYDQAPFPFVNDAVMSVMRGHMTNSIIVNPKYKNDQDWTKIADVIKWSRKNQSILKYTQPLLPVSWHDGKCPIVSYTAPIPREPYGYAHCTGSKGLIAVRNPWMTPAVYSLKLDGEIGLSPEAQNLSAVSLYPEARLYGNDLKYGDMIQVHLAPYELIVLSLGANQKTDDIPSCGDVIKKRITTKISRREVTRLRFDSPAPAPAVDSMSFVGDAQSALKVGLDVEAVIDAPQAELLVLIENKDVPATDPICSIKINGKEAPVTFSDSETGFAATGLPRPEHWLFIHAPLTLGMNIIRIDMMTRDVASKVSVWVLANRNGEAGKTSYRNALPQPETIQLDSYCLLPEISADDAGLPVESVQKPIEKIDGIYLDAVDFVAASGGYQKNLNFLNQSIFVCGRKFSRGICVVAPSKLAVALNGRYRRFQARVGVDQGMASYDRSGVIFQVFVDGVKLYDSGIVNRYDSLKEIDVDISDAKNLELVVLDGLNQDPVYHANWSVWGGARLLKD